MNATERDLLKRIFSFLKRSDPRTPRFLHLNAEEIADILIAEAKSATQTADTICKEILILLKTGPTGDYPEGELEGTDKDDGALDIAVSEYQGCVRIDFGSKIEWFAMQPEQSIQIAELLIEYAQRIENEP